MAGSVGNITTDITREGLVLNMDAANRASTIPNTSTTTIFNTIDTAISGTFAANAVYDSNTISPSYGFDGVGDYIDCGSTIYQVGTADVTISSWANTSTIASGNVDIFGLGDNAANTSEIRLQRQANKFGAYINSTIASGQQLVGSTTISTGQWYSVILVKSSNIFQLYLNGAPDNNITWSGGALNGNGGVIGAYWGGGSNGFYGNIANIQIYNRALSASEVLKNYNALKGRFGL
jgi:hypothetical protein